MLLQSETKIEPDLRLPFGLLGMYGLTNVSEYDSTIEDLFDRFDRGRLVLTKRNSAFLNQELCFCQIDILI